MNVINITTKFTRADSESSWSSGASCFNCCKIHFMKELVKANFLFYFIIICTWYSEFPVHCPLHDLDRAKPVKYTFKHEKHFNVRSKVKVRITTDDNYNFILPWRRMFSSRWWKMACHIQCSQKYTGKRWKSLINN